MSQQRSDYVIGHWRCECCGRSVECTLGKATACLTQGDWPVCCQYIMILVTCDGYQTPQPSTPSGLKPGSDGLIHVPNILEDSRFPPWNTSRPPAHRLGSGCFVLRSTA